MNNMPATTPASSEESGPVQVAVYARFTPLQKRTITSICALCGFLAPISTTSVLSAVPEITAFYHTTPTVISISNAVYLAFMGLASLLWGPWADLLGRRSVGADYGQPVSWTARLSFHRRISAARCSSSPFPLLQR